MKVVNPIQIHAQLLGVTPDQHHDRLHDHSNALDGTPIALVGVPNLPASIITSLRFPMARMPDGASGLLLTGQGAGADPVYRAWDIFDKFREFIPWESVTGWTTGGDAGFSVNPRLSSLDLATAATINSDAFLTSFNPYYSLTDAGRRITLELPFHMCASVAAQTLWVRLAQTCADPPFATAQHVGWELRNARLWASTSDGTNQTLTDTGVDVTVGAERRRLKLIFTPGTSCLFYVNDALAATHVTNLPTYAHLFLHIHLRNGQNADCWVRLGRILLEKEHA